MTLAAASAVFVGVQQLLIGFTHQNLSQYHPFLRAHLTSCDKMLEVYLESVPGIKIQGFDDIRTCAKLLCSHLGVLYF